MPAPATPSNYILQQANGQVFLSWDLVPGAASYRVQRSTDGVAYTLVASPTGNSYLDTAVAVGTNYYYQVASFNGATSNYTSPLQITPTVAGVMTLGQVRLAAQQRADRVNSQFVGTAEWNSYINQSYFELYDILVQVYGDEYFVTQLLFNTDGVAQQYPLPDGVNYGAAQPFYKLMGVDLGLNGSAQDAWITLKKFSFISRNRYVYPQITTNLLGIAGLRYRIVGNNIMFTPLPQAGQILRLWYVPRMVQLLQDTDMLNGLSGWTEYVIVDAAIKALQKEEADISVLGLQKEMLLTRINSAASNRDAGEPEVASDTRRYTDLYGFGSPNGDGPFGGY